MSRCKGSTKNSINQMENKKNDLVFIQMSLRKYQTELEKAAQLGAMKAMLLYGLPVKEEVSRADLNRRFGRARVERLLESGELTPHCIGENGRPIYKLSEVISIIN